MYTKCKSLFAAAAVAGAFFATSAVAQPNITVGTATAQQGDTVSIPVSFENDGTVVGMNFDIQYDATAFPSVDVASNCDGNDMSPGGVTCTNPSPGTITVVVATFPLANIASTQIGTIDFTVDGGAAFNLYDLTLANVSMSDSGGGAVTPDQLNGGSIDVVDTPPDELSELSVTPASIAFGTIDIGNLPTTDTFTAENTGGTNSSLTISAASYTGDSEFTITSNGCAGTTLNFGDTCDVTVEFDSATAGGPFNGSFDFTSDADTNATPSVAISGSADSVASLDVNPAFGPVDLGTVVIGNSATANGSISNSGSADGDFTCTLTGDTGVISTTPSPLSGTVPAGGSTDFSLTCAVPDTAAEGDTFNATLECSGDNGFGGTHDISCTATEFVPFPVPSMNKWGLAVLALLMVMVGGITVRFFRA